MFNYNQNLNQNLKSKNPQESRKTGIQTPKFLKSKLFVRWDVFIITDLKIQK